MAKISDVYSETAIADSGKFLQYNDTFGNVVQKDSPGKSFGFAKRILDMECWDMDSIEAAQQGSNEMTMDLVLGLQDFDDVRQVATTEYLLPVELKLNCVAFNLGFGELIGKDEHTRQYDMGVRFGANSVFLFTNTVAGQALNVISRWKRGTYSRKMKGWQVMTPSSFNSYIKFMSDYPYQYQTDVKDIEDKISSFLAVGDVDGCERYIKYKVLPKMEECYKVYNKLEIEYVVNQVKQILDKNYIQFNISDFDKEYLNLALNDIAGLIG